MSVSGLWPVAVVPVGRVACATSLWRAKGRLHVTVVVKARFALVPNAEMTPIMPEPVRPDLGETAPYLTQADVVLASGHAHPRSPTPAPALAVRLAVFREWAVIDKSLLVYPVDGQGRRSHAVTGAIAVVAGPMGAREPLGILVNPNDASRPGTLGALGSMAPERRGLLGEHPAPNAPRGILEIPDMFPWSYFQVAPPDQRTSFLRGDEWVVLDGLDAELPRLQSRLPRGVAQVFVYPPGFASGPSYPVHMEADLLSIDADRRECSLLWRGSFPVADELSARSVILVAGVALPNEPVTWPDIPTLTRNPILHAHGLAQPVSGPMPATAASQGAARVAGGAVEDAGDEDEDDADSMAATRHLNRDQAAAMFAGLELEEAPTSARSTEAAELEMSLDGVISVHSLSDSVILEVMKLVGEEAAVQVTNERVESKPRTALGLPRPDRSRALRPVGVEPAAASSGAATSRGEAPSLDETSVDQLELTLSDALTAQGLGTIDELAWRRGSGDVEEPPKPRR